MNKVYSDLLRYQTDGRMKEVMKYHQKQDFTFAYAGMADNVEVWYCWENKWIRVNRPQLKTLFHQIRENLIRGSATHHPRSPMGQRYEHVIKLVDTSGFRSFIQGERPGADRPQVDLMDLRKKRLVVLDEVDETKGFNNQFVKNLVGNDVIRCRGCFSNTPMEIQAQFKLIVNCNQRPQIDANKDDIWSKVYLLEFPIQCVDTEAQVVGEFTKLKDETLKDQLPKWGPDMMNILLEYFAIYREEKVEYTRDIQAMTRMERLGNDAVQNFIDEHMVAVEGGLIKMKEVIDRMGITGEICTKSPQDRKNCKEMIRRKVQTRIKTGKMEWVCGYSWASSEEREYQEVVEEVLEEAVEEVIL
ncbi:hypothetical protein HDU98_002318 [Podochytrium sp. JEL0797]|nr:hypothetical protein HDU98_002318 [Podochytrium sp. JEL0797]